MNPDDYKACHKNDYWTQLTEAEVQFAMGRGANMHHVSVDDNRRDNYNESEEKESSQRLHEVGEIASLAIAKALGIPYQCIINSFNAPDLKHNIECRLIGKDNWGLRVKKSDAAGKRVVGAICPKGRELDLIRLPGWYWAGEAQDNDEWKWDIGNRGKPCWVVPQEHLRPITELLSFIHHERNRKLTKSLCPF